MADKVFYGNLVIWQIQDTDGHYCEITTKLGVNVHLLEDAYPTRDDALAAAREWIDMQPTQHPTQHRGYTVEPRKVKDQNGRERTLYYVLDSKDTSTGYSPTTLAVAKECIDTIIARAEAMEELHRQSQWRPTPEPVPNATKLGRRDATEGLV